MDKQAASETVKVAADKLVDTVKAIVKEGNVRRVIVRNAGGRTLLDLPLTAGVVGVLLFPVFSAVAALVGLAKEFEIVVERHGTDIVKAPDPK
jgi:hypothetical protein